MQGWAASWFLYFEKVRHVPYATGGLGLVPGHTPGRPEKSEIKSSRWGAWVRLPVAGHAFGLGIVQGAGRMENALNAAFGHRHFQLGAA